MSLITTTAGIGALLASIWIGFRNSNKSKIETKLVSMLMLGLTISCIIGFISEVYTMAIFFTVVGFTTTAVGIGTQTIIQLEVEEVYRARVLTWWSSISFGSLTFGGIILGFVGEHAGLRWSFALCFPLLLVSFFTIHSLNVQKDDKKNFL